MLSTEYLTFCCAIITPSENATESQSRQSNNHNQFFVIEFHLSLEPMNVREIFHLLSVVSHHIIELLSCADIAELERACGNEVQLTQFRSIIKGNTIYDLTYQLNFMKWILARHVFPARVLINNHWKERDLAIFSEVISIVREIELQGASVTSKQLLNLVRFCLSPQRLCITTPTSLCETGLTSLVKSCIRGDHALVDLEFHILYLKRATLVAILKRCPALQALDVRQCPVLTASETLQDIVTYCPHITSVAVDKVSGAADDVLPSLALACKQLKKIHVECDIGAGVNLLQLPAFLAQCGRMEKVVLPGLVVSNATVSSLASHSALTLKVLHCTINTRIELPFEAHFTQLRELDMTMRHYQDADQIMIDIAQHCSHLEILVQRNCDRCTDASVLALATHSTQLQQLSLFRCLEFTPRALNNLVQCCQKLTLLHLTRIRSSAAEVATMLTHCTQLTSLKLGEPFLSRWDTALYAMAEHLKRLKQLYLSGYHLVISDSTVLHLVSVCKSLQILHILQPFYVCKDVAIVRAMEAPNGSHMKEFHVSCCSVRVYYALITLTHHRSVVQQDFTFNTLLNVRMRINCCCFTHFLL